MISSDDKSWRIEVALANATEPLSIDDICLMVFGRLNERERSHVRVVLHRLDARDKITKHAQTYEIKKAGA